MISKKVISLLFISLVIISCNDYKRGLKKMENEDYEGAEKDFTIAIGKNPENINAYRERASARFNLREYEKAIEDYKIVLENIPNDTTVLSDMGTANYNLRNYYEAISSYTKAISLDSTYYRNFKLRGESKYNLDDYDGAREDLNMTYKLIEEENSMRQQKAEIYYYLGAIENQLKNYKKVIEYMNTAVEFYNSGPIYNDKYKDDIYFNLAYAQRKLNQDSAALVNYTKVIEIDDSYSSAYNNRGLIKRDNEDLYGAIDDFTNAIEESFSFSGQLNAEPGALSFDSTSLGLYYNNRGITKEKLGDKEGACDDWSKGKSYNHSSATSNYRRKCN